MEDLGRVRGRTGGRREPNSFVFSVSANEEKIYLKKKNKMLVDSTGRLSEFSSWEKWLMRGGRAIKRAQRDVTRA